MATNRWSSRSSSKPSGQEPRPGSCFENGHAALSTRELKRKVHASSGLISTRILAQKTCGDLQIGYARSGQCVFVAGGSVLGRLHLPDPNCCVLSLFEAVRYRRLNPHKRGSWSQHARIGSSGDPLRAEGERPIFEAPKKKVCP